MSLLSDLNFFTTVATFGCVSFAASNFGIKLGKLASFSNTSGYQYVNTSKNSEKLYEDIASLATKNNKAPKWAKNKTELKQWCAKNQESARTWKEASEYCLIKNNVRHRLIDQGYKLNESDTPVSNGVSGTSSTEAIKCSDIFDSYADENLNSLGYLYGKSKCATLEAAAAAAG